MSRDKLDLGVRLYRPGDETAIQDLFNETFRDRSMEEWVWRFRNAPAGPGLIHVLEGPEGLVGHVAHVGFHTYINGSVGLVAHGGDTMVREHRRGAGALKLLVNAFVPGLKEAGYDARVGFPSDEAAKLFDRYGAGVRLGRVPQWVRWFTPRAIAASRGRALSSVTSGLAAVTLRAIAVGSSHPRPRLRLEYMAETGPEVDELAASSSSFASCIRVRDARYMSWRWFDQPDCEWTALAARSEEGELQGVVVFGEAESLDDDVAVGRIVDMLARDAASTRALLLAASRDLEGRGCGLVAFDYLDPRPWSRRVCYRCGFLPRGRGPNFLCLSLSPRAAAAELTQSWYVTRGDTDLA